MTPEEWKEAQRILQGALDLPPEERAGYVAVRCKDRLELRAEVESLLAGAEQADDFLERPASLELLLRPFARGERVGSFVIERTIGEGGMGVVYSARDVELDRSVALKFLDAVSGTSPEIRERFKREARAASAINHPNICTVYSVGDYDGRPFIVMELLEGEMLKQRIARGVMPLADLLDAAIGIAGALAAAHQAGVLHRDIKPGNLMLTSSGAVKILDFGIARHAHASRGDSGLTQTGGAIGTVGYMSPEQTRGERVDPRTDLFSFGAVLYEMATGKRAFDGDNAPVIFSAILNQTPRPPRSIHPGVPAALEQVILKALEKDANVRYQTASDLRADLQRLRRDSTAGRLAVPATPRQKPMSFAAAAGLTATKLSAPARRRDALRRGRLVEALEHSLSHSRLTLISAPAGSGKSTLLAELAPCFPQFRFCWLALDAEDNDPSRFATGLIASLEAAGLLPSDDVPAPNDPRQLVTFVINRIAEHTDDSFVLVFDDVHVITATPVHGMLDYLLDQAPANLRVILATRHDPPMSLARRRARGEVTEVRLEDLAFTPEETRQLAAECLGLTLSEKEASLLHARTEGWAAGLRLLAASLSQAPASRQTLLQSGMQGSRRIFDFLAEEVLDRQPEELRRFLLDTSILARLEPEICDALTDRADSLHVLEDLYRRSLYVVAADAAETSFRYHDLFGDFLRERLRRERPKDWNRLHVRAAQAQTSPHDRMRHLLAGQAWEEAAAEIERVGPEFTMRGYVDTLHRWIHELPETVRDERPRLHYLLGQAVWILSEFAQAQPHIEKALAGFRRNNDYAGQGEAIVALANSALMMNEMDRCRELLKEALTFDIPSHSRVQLHTASALDAIYRKNWPEATGHVAEVFALVESGVGRTNPLALMILLFAEGIPSYVDKLEAMCRTIRGQLAAAPDFSHATYYMLHSAVALHRGDLATGEAEGKRAMSIAQECGQVSMIQAALIINYCLVGAPRGEWETIDRWTTLGCDVSRHGQISRAWGLHFLYFQARGRWHTGNLEGLRETYEAAMTPNPVAAPPTVIYRSAIRGIMHMAERAYAQAEQAFRDAVRDEEGFQINRSTCSSTALLAYALLKRGRVDEAMEVFLPYLEECDRYNIAGRVMFENPHVVPLLRHAHERGAQRPFVERVLGLLGAPLNPMEGSGGETLSEREREVLLVMAEGLGNREIGERLHVSEATVKTHVQRVLRKLNATTRTQAVARARELMLL